MLKTNKQIMQALESELGIFEDVCNQSYLDISPPQTRTKNVISRRLSLKVMAAQLVLRSTPANLARWVLKLMPSSSLLSSYLIPCQQAPAGAGDEHYQGGWEQAATARQQCHQPAQSCQASQV